MKEIKIGRTVSVTANYRPDCQAQKSILEAIVKKAKIKVDIAFVGDRGFSFSAVEIDGGIVALPFKPVTLEFHFTNENEV